MGIVNEEELETRIDEMCEWWKSESRDAFLTAGVKMLRAGMTLDTVVGILDNLRVAMGAEYGD